MPVKDKLLKVIDPAKLKTDHADYSGKTKAEARREIKKLLDKYNFGITPERVSAERAKTQVTDAGLPDQVPGMAIIDGITWVRCYYDNTDNTGKIENGKPVAFDTVKGWGVTGINAKWSPEEYKIIGIALDKYDKTDAQGGKIPVRLVPPPAATAELKIFRTETEVILGRLQITENGEPKELVHGAICKVWELKPREGTPEYYELQETTETHRVFNLMRRNISDHTYFTAKKEVSSGNFLVTAEDYS